jgi:uncharacterized small protein (DUF1192 family)
MPSKKKEPPFRLTLTKEQQEMIKKATGKKADALELSIEELEERIAPMRMKY